jgi:hypothetical protein
MASLTGLGSAEILTSANWRADTTYIGQVVRIVGIVVAIAPVQVTVDMGSSLLSVNTSLSGSEFLEIGKPGIFLGKICEKARVGDDDTPRDIYLKATVARGADGLDIELLVDSLMLRESMFSSCGWK